MKQEFSIDDVVELIGSPGTRFKISQIWKLELDGSYRYSAEGRPYLPATALRLVDRPKVRQADELGALQKRIAALETRIETTNIACHEDVHKTITGKIRSIESRQDEILERFCALNGAVMRGRVR